jgi:hypothetical protein
VIQSFVVNDFEPHRFCVEVQGFFGFSLRCGMWITRFKVLGKDKGIPLRGLPTFPHPDYGG